MKVRCVSEYLSPEQIDSLGKGFHQKQTFGITKAKEYLSYGIVFFMSSGVYGTGVYVNVIEDAGHLIHVPLCLFEITDARASTYWEVRLLQGSSVALWPKSFHAEYYFDDLFEGVPGVVADFKIVRNMMESEAFQGS